MEVNFERQRLAQICNDGRQMVRKFGSERTKILQRRLSQLAAADSLEELRNLPGRCHELFADRKGQISLDLDGPHRLIFRPTDDPPPSKDDGGLDWGAVTTVTILDITDTH